MHIYIFFLISKTAFISVQSLSCVQLFVTPGTAACQASMSITNYWSWLKLKSIDSVMPSNHLILRHPLLLPSTFPSIRFFSNESVLCIRWPKYWSFSFSISPSNEYTGLISFRMDWLDHFAAQGILKSLLVWHCFLCFFTYLPWNDGTGCHDLGFWMLSLKPAFSLFLIFPIA